MIEKGLKEGLERGLAQGLEQGQQSEKEKIVLSMLEQGLDIDTISKYTKIDLEVVRSYEREFKERS